MENQLKQYQSPQQPYKFTKSLQRELKMNPFVHILKTIFIGVDGRYSVPNSLTPYNYGPVVGVQIRTKIPVRIWSGPNISGLESRGPDGVRLGAGIMLKRIHINMELQQKEENTSTASLSFNFLI